MRLSSGLVLAVPNTDALAEGAVVDAAVQQALREAEAAGVHGWRVTPFLLQVWVNIVLMALAPTRQSNPLTMKCSA